MTTTFELGMCDMLVLLFLPTKITYGDKVVKGC